MGSIYNIPASLSAVDVLAEKFWRNMLKSRWLWPTCCFCCLTAAPPKRWPTLSFDRGLTPTLLPKMVPIGDVEEDELFLTGFDFAESLASLAPAIERNERLLLFTRIILHKPAEFGIEKLTANQACYLAQELAGLIDTVHNENLSLNGWQIWSRRNMPYTGRKR